MLGSHLSISGGVVNALIRAEELGADCVQVFTKNQKQWKTKPLNIKENGEIGKKTPIGTIPSILITQ